MARKILLFTAKPDDPETYARFRMMMLSCEPDDAIAYFHDDTNRPYRPNRRVMAAAMLLEGEGLCLLAQKRVEGGLMYLAIRRKDPVNLHPHRKEKASV